MGDRVSISFKRDEDESVAFYSHWDGMDLVKQAEQYVKELEKDSKKAGQQYPLHRLEPSTVMVDFLARFLKDKADNTGRIVSNYYMEKDGESGDNSDNGHHVIEL